MYCDQVDVERLTDAQMRALLASRPVALLPMGAVESHGDHLPAGTDNILARRLASALVEKLAGSVPLLLLPLLPFGQVWSLSDAPGSFTLSNETVTRTIVEIARSVMRKGLATMVIVNAHYGNSAAIRDAQRLLKEDAFTLALFNYPGAETPTNAMRERPIAHSSFMHACEIETSYMLHLAPEHVRMELAISNYPPFPADFAEVPYRWSEFSASPVLGDATAATAEKGKVILDAVVDRMAELTAELYSRQQQPGHSAGKSP